MFFGKIEYACVLIVTILFFSSIFIGVYVTYAGSECLEEGYQEAKVHYDLTIYCSKQVDETHIVKPLNEVRKQ